MRALTTSRIPCTNLKNPHYTSLFEDPYQFPEYYCEKVLFWAQFVRYGHHYVKL